MLVTSALGYTVNPHYQPSQTGQYLVSPSVAPHQPSSLSPTLSSVCPTGGGVGVLEQQFQNQNNNLTESCASSSATAVMINPVSGELTTANGNGGTAAMNLDSVASMVAAAAAANNPIALQQIATSTGGVPLSMVGTDMGHMMATDYSGHILSTSPVLSVNGAKLSNGSSGQQSPHPNNIHSTAEYLQQLLKDRARLTAFPGTFLHAERLLDAEIARIRASLFQINGDEKKPLVLPEPEGAVIMRTEKVYVPVEEHPEFNFVGRILGPRGMTAKQLEMETGCKIMVRGRGSMRDKKKEESNRGKPNWEHLNDKLHVLITVEDTENRAAAKMQRAIDEVKKLLVPITEGEDELKKRQLMELAIINGTYRDSAQRNTQQQCLTLGLDAEQLKSLAIPMALASHPMRHQQSLGAPLILGHHRQYAGQSATTSALLNGNHAAAAAAAAAVHAASQQPQLITSSDGSTLLYTTANQMYGTAADYHAAQAAAAAAHHHHHHQYATLGGSQLIDFSAAAAAAAAAHAAAGTPVIDTTTGASKEKRARTTITSRYHPYDSLIIQRATTG